MQSCRLYVRLEFPAWLPGGTGGVVTAITAISGEWITPAVEPSLRAGEGGDAGAVDGIKSTIQYPQATKEEWKTTCRYAGYQ